MLQEIGQASGAISMLRIFGGMFGVAVFGAVFVARGGFASPKAFADGFSPAIYVSASVSAVGALIGLGMPGRRLTQDSAWTEAPADAPSAEVSPAG